MRRRFYVIHPHGASIEVAESAGEALRKCYIPSGFKNALCVIDSELVIWPATAYRSAFLAFIGTNLLDSPKTALAALETPPEAAHKRPRASKPVAGLCKGSARRLKSSRPAKGGISE